MPGQAPSAQPAAPTPTDQNQAAQNTGQPDYTKAWEEYYKKMGESKNTHTHVQSYSCAASLNPRVCVRTRVSSYRYVFKKGEEKPLKCQST